jgi:hypothetical protein
VFGAWPVFAAVTAGAFSATSAGASWTARNLGVPARLAILPCLLLASTPCLVSNLYGRGAWTELVAIGALAVALGAATSLTAGRARSRSLSVAALAAVVGVVAGTHNLTLLFAALFALPLAAAPAPVLALAHGELLRRHALVLAGALIGVALAGAFLAPDVWLSRTKVVQTMTKYFLSVDWQAETLPAIFNPANGISVAGTDFHSEALVGALVWVIVVVAVLASRRRLDARAGTALVSLGLLAVAITVLIVDPLWWLSFPKILGSIQFTYRLVSYLALVICSA